MSTAVTTTAMPPMMDPAMMAMSLFLREMEEGEEGEEGEEEEEEEEEGEEPLLHSLEMMERATVSVVEVEEVEAVTDWQDSYVGWSTVRDTDESMLFPDVFPSVSPATMIVRLVLTFVTDPLLPATNRANATSEEITIVILPSIVMFPSANNTALLADGDEAYGAAYGAEEGPEFGADEVLSTSMSSLLTPTVTPGKVKLLKPMVAFSPRDREPFVKRSKPSSIASCASSATLKSPMISFRLLNFANAFPFMST